MNPIHLAGGYFQLQPTLLMGEPGCPDRGTRVEVERIELSYRAGDGQCGIVACHSRGDGLLRLVPHRVLGETRT